MDDDGAALHQPSVIRRGRVVGEVGEQIPRGSLHQECGIHCGCHEPDEGWCWSTKTSSSSSHLFLLHLERCGGQWEKNHGKWGL